MDVEQTIKFANSILPGVAVPEGEDDPRWKAIIGVGEFAQNNPEEVWSFVAKWGIHPDEDLRAAIATCLLEHLLEHHFERVFPRVEYLAEQSMEFAETFLLCHQFGDSEKQENSLRFVQLKKRIQQVRSSAS